MAFWAGWLTAWSQIALAQSWYLETEPATTREPVLEVARIASEAGLPGRVVRLYVQGTGWRYVFRSEEKPDDKALLQQLPSLRATTSIGVRLIRLDDGEVTVVDERAVEREPAVPIDRSLDAQEVLRRVVRAHGGPAPADRIDAAGAVVFRFDRTLDDRKVAHSWVRRGNDAYLQVDILSGKGAPSRLGIVAGKPWMDGDDDAELDVLRVREQIERFSPSRVLSLALEFTAGLPGGREFELMTIGEGDRVGPRSFVSLEWSGDRQTAPLKMLVDPGTWRIAAVIWGTTAEAIRWSFDGYEELGDGAVFPTRIEVRRGEERIDLVEVHELDLDPTLLPEWFPAP